MTLNNVDMEVPFIPTIFDIPGIAVAGTPVNRTKQGHSGTTYCMPGVQVLSGSPGCRQRNRTVNQTHIEG